MKSYSKKKIKNKKNKRKNGNSSNIKKIIILINDLLNLYCLVNQQYKHKHKNNEKYSKTQKGKNGPKNDHKMN